MSTPQMGPSGSPTPALRSTSLRSTAPSDLRIGAAVAGGGGHHRGRRPGPPLTDDARYRAFLAEQFSTLTPENQMKWEALRPDAISYDFTAVDALVDFAAAHDQHVRGHTLMWHNQNPAWLEHGDFTAAQLRDILREHVHTVVGRYAGRVQQWDVANEIFTDDAALRRTDNIWLRQIGPDIIADVFRWAHEADPEALLFFNDYNVEGTNAKADAYYDLIRDLLAADVPVHGFGIQGHLALDNGFDDRLQQNLQRFDDLGLHTAITEFDVRGSIGDDGEMSAELRTQQADFYVRALQACLSVPGCRSVTIWGVLDEQSWVPHAFAGQGDALLFEGDYQPKPAYFALQRTLAEAART